MSPVENHETISDSHNYGKSSSFPFPETASHVTTSPLYYNLRKMSPPNYSYTLNLIW